MLFRSRNSVLAALVRWRQDCSGGTRNSGFFSTSLMSLLMLVMSQSGVSPGSRSFRSRWVLLSLSCRHRFGEVCLPTGDEIGLVASYHLSWWFSSPLGFFVVRRIEASAGSWGVRFPITRRCDGHRSSSARSFNDNKACCFRYATQDGNNKLSFFAREEAGLRSWMPVAGGEENREMVTRTGL